MIANLHIAPVYNIALSPQTVVYGTRHVINWIDDYDRRVFWSYEKKKLLLSFCIKLYNGLVGTTLVCKVWRKCLIKLVLKFHVSTKNGDYTNC